MDDFKRREFIKLSALGFASIALQLNSLSSYAQNLTLTNALNTCRRQIYTYVLEKLSLRY